MGQSLHALAAKLEISELDLRPFQEMAAVELPIQKHTLEVLRYNAIKECPELQICTDLELLNLDEIASSNKIKGRDQFSTQDITWITNVADLLKEMFPSETYVVSNRVCTKDQFDEKYRRSGVRALFDIVGFRIVPKNAKNVSQVIRSLREIRTWKTLFVFNTVLFSDSDFHTHIGPTSSSFYRAVHFYVAQNGVCIEIQIRFPATHAWSEIHHATMYKPRVNVDDATKKLIWRLGATANFLDFRSMVR